MPNKQTNPSANVPKPATDEALGDRGQEGRPPAGNDPTGIADDENVVADEDPEEEDDEDEDDDEFDDDDDGDKDDE